MSSIKNRSGPITEQDDDESGIMSALLLSTSIVVPLVLKAAIDLNLFDIIYKAGLNASISPSEIASQLSTKNPDAPLMLDRILHLLASHSVLTCSLSNIGNDNVERLYGLAPAGKFFVKDRDGCSLVSFFQLLNNHHDYHQAWNHLKDAVFYSGNPFFRAHGMSLFQYANSNMLFSKCFDGAMSELSNVVMNRILEIYKGFEGLTSLVDVGGGNGTCLNMIISKYANIKAINFDLPHVIKNAPPYPGIEHVEGDMFMSIPKGEALFMKAILHNWDDEHCLKLLRNCYEALPKNGKVIIIDWIMPLEPDTSMSTKYVTRVDNQMLTCLGGKERTREEFEILSKSVGFSSIHLVCGAYSNSLMEFYK